MLKHTRGFKIRASRELCFDAIRRMHFRFCLHVLFSSPDWRNQINVYLYKTWPWSLALLQIIKFFINNSDRFRYITIKDQVRIQGRWGKGSMTLLPEPYKFKGLSFMKAKK